MYENSHYDAIMKQTTISTKTRVVEKMWSNPNELQREQKSQQDLFWLL